VSGDRFKVAPGHGLILLALEVIAHRNRRYLMPRSLAFLSLPVFVVAVSHAAPVPKGPAEKPYIATAAGTVLVYSWTTTDDKGGASRNEVAEVVTAVKPMDAGLVITRSHKLEGSEYAASDTFLLSEKGLFTTGTSMTGPGISGERGWKFDPPACLLKLPFKDGAKWEYDIPAQPGGLVGVKATNTAFGPEEVTVPAGKYMAIRVEQRSTTTNGTEVTTTFWYAREVGLVKMANADVVQELKSFTPPK
jgi:hypothetical protein